MMPSHRRRQSAFSRPATPVSISQSMKTDAQIFRPRRQWLRLPLKCQHDIRPAVSGLLLDGGPFTIKRLIVAVVINTIQLMQFRRISHVLVKVKKVLAPALTDSNPSAAVALVRYVLRVIATLQHGVISIVDSGVTSVVGLPSAAAANYLTIIQEGRSDVVNDTPTVTATLPKHGSTFLILPNNTLGDQSPKSIPDHFLLFSRIGVIKIRTGHSHYLRCNGYKVAWRSIAPRPVRYGTTAWQ